ncbi:unnamed protein product [Schistosoma curassoni]|uniref:Endo/exonuclease/phosphatase domain-containing protein n=1 Tax=Schistosoma curassoni TaxID=6186 RepID=A0A183L3D2_9TREM|nr:unnamed protein product [Schistosoma curassoni]
MCSQAASNSELNIQNYRLYRCDRETKRGGGCIIYALDTQTTNKVEDSVLNGLPESVWLSVNTLNHSLLLGCIYRAHDSSNNGNDLIINAFIHASSLNFNAKVITGDFNYPGINWSTGSCQSSNDEFSVTINMHFWSLWLLNELSFTFNHVTQYAETSHYDIRNSLALVKQTHSKSSLYMNYFTCKFSKLWNNLPQSIRTIESLPLFVRCIDAYCSSENALDVRAPVSVSHSTSDIIGILNV